MGDTVIARWVVLAALVAACGPAADQFQIQWILERGNTQMCSSDQCANISMGCDAAVMIRIVDADDDAVVYYTDCFMVEGGRDLCELDQIRLDADKPIPNTMVKIQVAVWPYSPATADCPDVAFDLDGRVSGSSPIPRPAIAGEAYFSVGSSELAPVVLGCIDEASLDTACNPDGETDVSIIVDDFDTRVSVAPAVGSRLSVSIGEPRFDAQEGLFVLTTDDVVALERTTVEPPVWGATDLDLSLDGSVCVQVLEGVVQATATLFCDLIEGDEDALALSGVLVDKTTIDMIDAAIDGGIPNSGLVLGLVVDHDNQPAAGVAVTGTNGATVTYLSADGTSSIADGTTTTASGLFYSTDAPYALAGVTQWHAALGELREVRPGIGGLVDAKVTIILLELEDGVITP